MESSEPTSSLSHVSLSSAQMAPRKLSLSTSLPFSTNDTSVPIRAPLTLDDESGTESNDDESGSESNDDELDSVTSFVSLSVSDFEGNEDDPDENCYGFVDEYETCNVRPFVGFCDETSVGSVESGFNKLFVRPIAQLSWDEDGDCDNDHGNFGDFNEVQSEEDCIDRTETVVPGVAVVEKISVAPRVKGSENDFWGDREEYNENVVLVEGNGGLGVLEDCEEPNLKVDLGVEQICVENIKIEAYDDGGLETCDCEETLASTEGDFAEKNSKRDVSLGDCEESLVASEEGATEKIWKVDAGFGKFCVEKLNIEECGVVAETNMVRRKSVEDFCCLGLLDEESDVVNGCVEDELSLVMTKAADILVSSIGDFEAGRNELDLSVFSASDQDNGADCDEVVEDSTEEIMREMDQSVAAFSRLRTEDSEDDLQRFDGLGEEEQNKIKKIILLRVKFLRLVHRIGISLEDSKVAQVLDKLALGFPKETSHFGTIESTKKKALACEAENQSDIDFSLNILVLGKSGVGKSATINLIFGEKKAAVNAFEPATTAVKEIVGIINGVKIRILDTPGLKVHASEQSSNRKLLATISKRLRKFCPDIVLYVDRLDAQTIETNSPVLKSITSSLGSSIWKNAIVTLTHSSSAPSDGFPVSLKILAARKLHSLLDSIGKANPMDRDLLCPVSLVENHPLISEDSDGRADLLLLCFSMKVLSEVNFTSIPETVSNWTEKVLGFSNRSLLASLLLQKLKLHDNAEANNHESEDKKYLDSSKFEIQAVGDQISCIIRNETKATNFKTNKTNNVAASIKIEDQITLGERPSLAAITISTQCGTPDERGAKFEVRDKGGNPRLWGVSMAKWRGDLALSSAFLFLQTRFAIGRRGTSMVAGLELATEQRPRVVLGVVGSDPLHFGLVWILQMVIPVFLCYHGAQNQI